MTDSIFIALGAIIGVLAGFVSGEKSITHRLESLAMGIFGSGVGGELLFNVIGQPGASAVTPLRIALAVACSIVMLVLLTMMRGAVGPLRAGKSKKRGG